LLDQGLLVIESINEPFDSLRAPAFKITFLTRTEAGLRF
jgi:uncharacterized protein YllA (UPF0747 family)